jgi:hypothetical protein
MMRLAMVCSLFVKTLATLLIPTQLFTSTCSLHINLSTVTNGDGGGRERRGERPSVSQQQMSELGREENQRT